MHRTSFFVRSGALLAALSLSACGYILPDSPSAARFNAVEGERHAPTLNPRGSGAESHAIPADSTTSEQTAQADTPNFPPVDEATKARAAQEIASAPLAPPQESPTAAPVQTPTVTATVAGESTELPAAVLSPSGPSTSDHTSASGRHVPIENAAAGMQLSANDYPDLATVPPRPPMTGDASTATQLSKVRTGLEQDRSNAAAAKEQLSKDAGAEPSLLPAALPETTGTVPPPTPVSVTPIEPPSPAPAPVSMPQSSIVPPPIAVGNIPTPPTPVFAPPPPPMDMASLPPRESAALNSMAVSAPPAAPPMRFQPAQQVIAAPVAPAPTPQVSYRSASTLPPIILHPPGEDAPAPIPTPSFTPTPTWSAPQQQAQASASSGGFDPMAGSAATASNQSTVYGAVGYLPSSRYTR